MADDEWLKGIPETEFSWITGPGAEMSKRETKIRIGEVFGARSFIVSKTGWLAGITFQKVWRPGINTAQCYRTTGWSADGTVVHTKPIATTRLERTGDVYEDFHGVQHEKQRSIPTGWDYYLDEDTVKRHTMTRPEPVRENDIAAGHNMAHCGCGLHAYVRGSMDYGNGPDRINGIVAGSGRMVRGSRGFRSQHAELKALYLPRDEALLTASRHWNETKQDLSEAMADAPSNLNPRWDTAAGLIELISTNYPTVPIYQDIEEMFTFWPTTDDFAQEEL